MVLSSFSPAAVQEAASGAPEVARALIVREIPNDWTTLVERAGASALHIADVHATETSVTTVLQSGLGVSVFTVNDKARAEELWSWGVWSVFSDSPAALLR